MASIIENRYSRQSGMLEEYASKVLAKRMRFGALLGCVLIAFIIISSVAHGDYATAIAFAVCLIIPAVTMFMAPSLSYRDILGKEHRIHGDKTDYETVIKFGDSITIDEDGYSLQAEYSDIIAVYYLEKSCVLMLSKTNGILLDVNGFTKGNMKQLKKLLEKRCGSVKQITK